MRKALEGFIVSIAISVRIIW